MNTNIFTKARTWLLAFLILFAWVIDVNAEISLLDDKLTIAGFLRQQVIYNMGTMNPYNSRPQYNQNFSAYNPYPNVTGYHGAPPDYPGYAVQSKKNWCNLNRTWLVTEIDYTPNDILKFYTKIRVIADETRGTDSRLYDYNPLALSTDHYATTMRLGEDDDVTIEAWEIYADIDLDSLWIRIGKQQIVWGEMISARILDVVNPLDQSWHFTHEPEEFENIRIPQWMLRAVLNVDTQWASWLEELYIEGFWNPGDIVPTNDPQIGNPYKQNYQYEYDPNAEFAWGGLWQTTEVDDRRGDDEFGFRLGWKVGQFAGTFNYASLYADDPMSYCDPESDESRALSQAYDLLIPAGPAAGLPIPFGVWDAIPGALGPNATHTVGVVKKEYPRIDVIGTSFNYAFDKPFSTVMTVEVAYIPNMPWYTSDCFQFENVAITPGPTGSAIWMPYVGIDYDDTEEYNFAINFQRFSNVFPGQPFMNIIFQYQGKYVPNADELKWTPGSAPPSVTTNANSTGGAGTNEGNIVEKICKDAFVLSVSQDFGYKTYKASCVTIWQPDGAYSINPGFKYSPGDNWRFDVYARWWGGSAFDNHNKSSLNYFGYQDEVNFRITYQF